VERRRGEAEQWRREAERRGCKAEQRWAIELAEETEQNASDGIRSFFSERSGSEYMRYILSI
jgi:hypothetical protein